jgi:hypothetical protein
VTAQGPAPPVPPDADLRPLPYMPLDVKRLRDSDLAATATGEEFRAAILLWCAAWHQVPAASLPDDDRVLAMLAGYGRDLGGWQAVRRTALSGFERAADGRLYHPVVAEKALQALAARTGLAERREIERARKKSVRSLSAGHPADREPPSDGHPADRAPPSGGHPADVRPLKGEGTEGKGDDGSAGDAEAASRAGGSLRARLFGPVAAWLTAAGGKTEAQARSFLGRCCRDHGDAATLAACLEAQGRGVPDPMAYIHAILKGGANGRGANGGRAVGGRAGRRNGAIDEDYRADMLAGIGLGAG